MFRSVLLFIALLLASAVTFAAPPTCVTGAPGDTTVTLTGVAPTTDVNGNPLTGVTLTYNVYRATTSGGEGATPYKSGLTTPQLTDATLTPGTYYYTMTAVDANGESTPTPEVCKSIAKPAAAPLSPAPLTIK